MFPALANAIAFEVGFSLFGTGTANRRAFIVREVCELRANSGLPDDTRAITADLLGEAVAYKVNKLRLVQAAPITLASAYVLVRKGTPQYATNLSRFRYARYGNARAAAAKLNRLAETEGAKVEALDELTRIKRLRLRLVRNAASGALVLESNDTPFTCSVASESYWAN